jgi:hypothetical protein
MRPTIGEAAFTFEATCPKYRAGSLHFLIIRLSVDPSIAERKGLGDT